MFRANIDDRDRAVMRARLCFVMHAVVAAEQDFLFSFYTSIYWIFYEHADFLLLYIGPNPLNKIIEHRIKKKLWLRFTPGGGSKRILQNTRQHGIKPPPLQPRVLRPLNSCYL